MREVPEAKRAKSAVERSVRKIKLLRVARLKRDSLGKPATLHLAPTDLKHLGRDVHARHLRLGKHARGGDGEVGGARCNVENSRAMAIANAALERAQCAPAPPDIEAKRHDAVQRVISARDSGEERPPRILSLWHLSLSRSRSRAKAPTSSRACAGCGTAP